MRWHIRQTSGTVVTVATGASIATGGTTNTTVSSIVAHAARVVVVDGDKDTAGLALHAAETLAGTTDDNLGLDTAVTVTMAVAMSMPVSTRRSNNLDFALERLGRAPFPANGLDLGLADLGIKVHVPLCGVFLNMLAMINLKEEESAVRTSPGARLRPQILPPHFLPSHQCGFDRWKESERRLHHRPLHPFFFFLQSQQTTTTGVLLVLSSSLSLLLSSSLHSDVDLVDLVVAVAAVVDEHSDGNCAANPAKHFCRARSSSKACHP